MLLGLPEEKGVGSAEGEVSLRALLVDASPDLEGNSEDGLTLQSFPSELRGLGLRSLPWICHWMGTTLGRRCDLKGAAFFRQSS